MSYVDPDLIADEGAVAEGNLAALADLLPNFQASEGHLETALAEAFGISEATVVALILSNERNQYAGFGERVVGLARHSAVVATSLVTFTLADADGHLIPAGYSATFLTPDGTSVTVATTQDVVVAATESSALHIPVAAIEAGPDGNSASGDAIDRDDVSFISAVTLEQPTAGGQDEEPLDDYVDRVARRNRRGRVPAAPDDYADFATDIDGVARAIAVNRYDPAFPSSDSLGHVTVYLATAAGVGVGDALKTAVSTYLNGIPRVMAALVHVADPTALTIDVSITIQAAPGVGDTAAQLAVVTAVRAFMNRATWAADDNALGGWAPSRDEISVYDVAAVVDDLAEVARIATVTLNGATDPIPVPRTSLVTAGTVTVPVA